MRFVVIVFLALSASLSIHANASNARQRVVHGRDGCVVRLVPHNVDDGIDGRNDAHRKPINYKTRVESVSQGKSAFNWTVMANLEIDFVAISAFNKDIVYVTGELGHVLKTSDGGVTWGPARMDAGSLYWYGVKALNASSVVVSGFNNTDPSTGVMSWSRNGAWTWGPIIIPGSEWLQEISFTKSNGIIMGMTGGSLHTTNDGASFQYVSAGGSWHEGRFVNAPNGVVRVAGDEYCVSTNGGSSYSCQKPIDEVFDGGVHFLDDLMHGIVGGGSIQPNVAGWVHVTSDGGKTWSKRSTFPYPIRQVAFLNEYLAIATGGDFYSNVGGIWISKDGGINWLLELDTGVELQGFEIYEDGNTRTIWVAGASEQPFVGKIFKTIVTL